MNTVNNNLECSTELKPRKWWNSYEFPLVPMLRIKKGNEHNTSRLDFHWLIFKAWTLDAPSFEIGIVMCDHWGIGVIGILPYLRWVIAIPCPRIISNFSYTYLWRKPKKEFLA